MTGRGEGSEHLFHKALLRELQGALPKLTDWSRSMIEAHYPEGFNDFLEFLCKKYGVDRRQVFVEYSSKPPPPINGGRPGYYDGLLSYREKNGRLEFLITVFKVARDPLLTLGHEFAHLVDDVKSGNVGKRLSPPNDTREKSFDDQARQDLNQFWMQRKIDNLKRGPVTRGNST